MIEVNNSTVKVKKNSKGVILKLILAGLPDVFLLTFQHSDLNLENVALERIGKSYGDFILIPVPSLLFETTGTISVNVDDSPLTIGETPFTIVVSEDTDALTSNCTCDADADRAMIEYLVENKYSTDEIDTGNKWIDGKSIYRTVVKTTTSLTNALGEVATLPSEIDTPVSIRGFAKYGGDGGWRPIPTAYHGGNTWNVLVYIAGATVVMAFGSSWTGTKNIVLIVEYTKRG